MNQGRSLFVIADDFGIGPETSRGILDLARLDRISGTVLLVNSPYAEVAVATWRRAGVDLDLGWHPCLTLDAPVLPPKIVPSLVRPDGLFWPLGAFVRRLYWGRIACKEIEAELRAQLERYCDLTGQPPALVNAHHHVNLFHPVGTILLKILDERRLRPYVRRIREPWRLLRQIRGARFKRTILNCLGRPLARRQEELGFPGADWLCGITDPPCVHDAEFFVRWLSQMPGTAIELSCHPGERDASLLGRDCTPDDGMLERRVQELRLLRDPSFYEACRAHDFELVRHARVA